MTTPPGGPPFQQPYGGQPPGHQPGPGYGPPPGYPPPTPTGGRTGPHPTGSFGTGPGTPQGYAPAATVIDIGRDATRKAIMGSVVAGVLGMVALVAGLFGAVDGGAVAGIIAIVIGALLLALPLATILMRRKLFRRRALVFEPAGIRWDDPHGQPWAIAWSELAAVSISKHSPRLRPTDLAGQLAGKAADKMMGGRAFVRLDLYPADASFAGQHPEMAHLWQRQGVTGGYRLPLGSGVRFLPDLAAALGRFAPRIYRGIHATEGVMGLR